MHLLHDGHGLLDAPLVCLDEVLVVDEGGALKVLGLDEARGRLAVLLGLLQNVASFGVQDLVVELLAEANALPHVARAQVAPGHARHGQRDEELGAARASLGVLRVERRVKHPQRRLRLPAELELLAVLHAYIWHLRGVEGLRQLQSLVPLQKVAAHLERRRGPRRGQEELLGPRVVAKEQRDLARQLVLVLHAQAVLQRHHHGRVSEALAIHAARQLDVEQLHGLVRQGQPEPPLVQVQRGLPGHFQLEQCQGLAEA